MIRMFLSGEIIKRWYGKHPAIVIDKWCFEDFTDFQWFIFCEYDKSLEDLKRDLNASLFGEVVE